MKLQIYKKVKKQNKLIFENEYQKEKIDFEINSIFSFEDKKYLVLNTFKILDFSDFSNDLKTILLQVFTEEIN